MHPSRLEELAGCRLAFAQGGEAGFRLVYLSPPVEAVKRDAVNELRWGPAEMPFRYKAAPILIDNSGRTDVPKLRDMLQGTDRGTWNARFSSRFRSRRRPLPHPIGLQMCRVFDHRYLAAKEEAVAASYEESMPYEPPRIDQDRAATYTCLTEGLPSSRNQDQRSC